MPGRSFVAALAFAAACAAPSPPPPVTVRHATPIGAPADRVWQAALDALASRGFALKTIDRASGVVITEPQPVPLPEKGQSRTYFADCGRGSLGVQGFPSSVVYSVRVMGDSAQSIVRLTARWFMRLPSGADAECSSSGVAEGDFERAVKARAEAR